MGQRPLLSAFCCLLDDRAGHPHRRTPPPPCGAGARTRGRSCRRCWSGYRRRRRRGVWVWLGRPLVLWRPNVVLPIAEAHARPQALAPAHLQQRLGLVLREEEPVRDVLLTELKAAEGQRVQLGELAGVSDIADEVLVEPSLAQALVQEAGLQHGRHGLRGRVLPRRCVHRRCCGRLLRPRGALPAPETLLCVGAVGRGAWGRGGDAHGVPPPPGSTPSIETCCTRGALMRVR